MSGWDLPTSAVINGNTYEIRSDYRAVLDVLAILGDAELTDRERGAFAMTVFYPGFETMPSSDYEQAAQYLQWFAGGGDMRGKRPPCKLADWKQDFPLIVGPVNRVVGREIRAMEYLHWWTFLGAYYEVGDCLFAQVVAIRKKRSKGKKLEKWEREFYNENRDLIEFEVEETSDDADFFEFWAGEAKEGGNG